MNDRDTDQAPAFPVGRRGVLRGILAIAAAFGVTGCRVFGKSISYRYRLIVEVDTPQGLSRGSSVIQVDKTDGIGLEGSHLDTRVTGDAVAVDLPNGQTLFALLDHCANAPRFAIDPHLPELPKSDDWWRRDGERLLSQTGVFELPRNAPSPFGVDETMGVWPTLVHFGDLHDPQTLERVDPDDPEATFGVGVRVKRIAVQMTDDPVTSGIEKRLPWLENLAGLPAEALYLRLKHSLV